MLQGWLRKLKRSQCIRRYNSHQTVVTSDRFYILQVVQSRWKWSVDAAFTGYCSTYINGVSWRTFACASVYERNTCSLYRQVDKYIRKWETAWRSDWCDCTLLCVKGWHGWWRDVDAQAKKESGLPIQSVIFQRVNSWVCFRLSYARRRRNSRFNNSYLKSLLCRLIF